MVDQLPVRSVAKDRVFWGKYWRIFAPWHSLFVNNSLFLGTTYLSKCLWRLHAVLRSALPTTRRSRTMKRLTNFRFSGAWLVTTLRVWGIALLPLREMLRHRWLGICMLRSGKCHRLIHTLVELHNGHSARANPSNYCGPSAKWL